MEGKLRHISYYPLFTEVELCSHPVFLEDDGIPRLCCGTTNGRDWSVN